MSTLEKLLFITILLVSCSFRFWRLDAIPEGFHSDEAAFGYNAYSILKTGRDEYGKVFPLTLQSFGDYKAALYAYTVIPFMAVLGPTELSVRLPSCVAGMLWVVVIYMFVWTLSKKKSYAFVAMVLSAVSPLPVLLSRVQSDPLLSVLFILVGTWFFFLWKEKRKIFFIFLCCTAWLFSVMTYVLPRMFLLIFIPFLLFWFRDTLSLLQKKIFGGVFIVIAVSVVILSLTSSPTRLQQVSVFSSPTVMLPLEEKIREDGGGKASLLTTRMYHNKVVEYGMYCLHNYFEYINFNFLFYEANQPAREKIPNIGVFLLIELPFLLVGIYTILKKKIHWGIFCLIWAFGVPALLSFTRDEIPNIHRFFLASAPFHIIISVGIVSLFYAVNKAWRKLFIAVVLMLFSINVYYFLHNLFVHQPIHLPYNRGYAYKALVLRTKDRSFAYDVVVSQKVLEHMLFFWPMDPKVYLDMGSPRDGEEQWMGKYFFVSDPCPSNSKKYRDMMKDKKVLYMDRSECHVPSDDILEIIRWKEGSAAFYLVEPHEPLVSESSL